MAKTFVIGDIHGANKALLQVLQRANFNYESDTLISIGDVVDCWPESAQCVAELMKIRKLIAIRGNHDVWALEMLRHRIAPRVWIDQGGQATIDSYINTGKVGDQAHLEFFEKQVSYHIDNENRLFVHGGFDTTKKIEHQKPEDLYFNRSLWRNAQYCEESGEPLGDVNKFREIYIGHTQTIIDFPDMLPANILNVWNVDTGCKSQGKLSLLNVETKEFYQSDVVKDLYRTWQK